MNDSNDGHIDLELYDEDEPNVARLPAAPFVVRTFGVTHPGRVRSCNQDQFAIVELARTMKVHGTSIPQADPQYSSHRGHVLIVADGLGGHRGGEVASATTVLTVEAFLLNTLNRFFYLKGADEYEILREFRSALLEADSRLFEESFHRPEFQGMGTTLTMAFAADWRLYIAHAGDSRCYLFSKDQLRQLTEDHTVVAEMARGLNISPQAMVFHPSRNVLTNAIGGDDPGLDVELHRLALEHGDVVLLCSDGLTNMVTDERIAAAIREEQQPQRICERLVSEANENGGRDNITVVAATFTTA